MRYLKRLIIMGLWTVVTASCAQSQNDAAPIGAAEDENPKAAVDSKAIESYWTKEQMDKAKPMPTPTVIIDPNASETPQPIEQLPKQGVPSGEPGGQ